MLEIKVNAPPKIGHYHFESTIGAGAFALVMKAHDDLNNITMACKIVPKKRLSTPDLQSRFETEVHIFQQLSHPGIVKLYDLLKDDENYYIFMEYCPHGELFKFIVDHGSLNEVQARFVVREILETLQYVHSKGIAHRDLKPENLLLSETGNIKLSDFGLSKYVGELGLCDTPCGSPCYASPECLSGTKYNAMASDVWSTGVILYAMLTGQLPWTKRNQVQLFQQIRAGQYNIPDKLTDNCKSFIGGLMTVDINNRLTIEEALRHPWMLEDTHYKKPNFFPDMPMVSVKKVDMLFDNSYDDDFSGVASDMVKCNSTEQLTIDSIIRSLNTKKQPSHLIQSSLPELRKKPISVRKKDGQIQQTSISPVNNNASICNGLNSTQKKLENSKTRNPAATRSRLVGVPLTQSRKPF